MAREFDSFIIIPALAEGPVHHYSHYLDAPVEQTPEMSLLYINGISSVYMHDASAWEEKTVEYLEKAPAILRTNIQAALTELNPDWVLNQNAFIYYVDILSEQVADYHLVELAFMVNGEKVKITNFRVA
ncbi:hypothetical protein [Pontibacter sp. G13]|uniref:hypothetical protein n=1 Tax=Pontibacter sp. G13 TaxID=3074898 RepID=UPI00288AF6FE|nr:hypothetical protein [Pontibacter sp. G13]WNJ17496.1 hypothetical protein RJD25_21825 [Pontibacter sp. G13]